jgi:hypothetical protein
MASDNSAPQQSPCPAIRCELVSPFATEAHPLTTRHIVGGAWQGRRLHPLRRQRSCGIQSEMAGSCPHRLESDRPRMPLSIQESLRRRYPSRARSWAQAPNRRARAAIVLQAERRRHEFAVPLQPFERRSPLHCYAHFPSGKHVVVRQIQEIDHASPLPTQRVLRRQ